MSSPRLCATCSAVLPTGNSDLLCPECAARAAAAADTTDAPIGAGTIAYRPTDDPPPPADAHATQPGPENSKDARKELDAAYMRQLEGYTKRIQLVREHSIAAGEPLPPDVQFHDLFTNARPHLRLAALIAKGGMGEVWRAYQPDLGRWVAVKFMVPAPERRGEFTQRFVREARALAQLTHPNIVSIYDFGVADGMYFIIMEYLYSNLRSSISANEQVQAGTDRPAEERAATRVRMVLPDFLLVCAAVAHAHEMGFVHRDLKPENILEDKTVKLADFGVSQLRGSADDPSRITAVGQVVGTLRYMAPEQLETPDAVDHRADIYALGLILYELLTGRYPYGKFDPPSAVVEDERLDAVVFRAIARDPAQRYQSVTDMRADLALIAETPLPILRINQASESIIGVFADCHRFVTAAVLPLAAGLLLIAEGGHMLPWWALLAFSAFHGSYTWWSNRFRWATYAVWWLGFPLYVLLGPLYHFPLAFGGSTVATTIATVVLGLIVAPYLVDVRITRRAAAIDRAPAAPVGRVLKRPGEDKPEPTGLAYTPPAWLLVASLLPPFYLFETQSPWLAVTLMTIFTFFSAFVLLATEPVARRVTIHDRSVKALLSGLLKPKPQST